MENTYKVSVIGAGFVGLPTSAVLAHNNPNLEVYSICYVVSSLWQSWESHKILYRWNHAILLA